ASLSDGVIAADTNGNVRYMNSSAEAITGWRSTEAIGRPIEEVYPLTHMDGSAVRQGQLRRALATRTAIPKERFLVTVKNDGQIPVEDSASPIVQDEHLLGAATIFLDISSRIEAEQVQQIEQKRLRTEVQNTSARLGRTEEELRSLSDRLI